jgi:hypothetical protein
MYPKHVATYVTYVVRPMVLRSYLGLANCSHLWPVYASFTLDRTTPGISMCDAVKPANFASGDNADHLLHSIQDQKTT